MIMDSFEYYLMYFKDSSEFIKALNDDVVNEEVLVALEKLLLNNKISFESEKESIFKKIWDLMRCEHKQLSETLEFIFEALLSPQRFEAVKYWILGMDVTVNSSWLRIIRIVSKVFISSSQPATEKFFKDMSLKIIDVMYRETCFHSEIM